MSSKLFFESKKGRSRYSLSDSHSTSDGDVESSKLLVLVEDSNVSQIVAVDIDVVGRRNSDSDLELSGLFNMNNRVSSNSESRKQSLDVDLPSSIHRKEARRHEQLLQQFASCRARFRRRR